MINRYEFTLDLISEPQGDDALTSLIEAALTGRFGRPFVFQVKRRRVGMSGAHTCASSDVARESIRATVFADAPAAPEEQVSAAMVDALKDVFPQAHVNRLGFSRLDIPNYDTDCPRYDITYANVLVSGGIPGDTP